MIIESARYPSDFVGFRAELLIKGLVIAIEGGLSGDHAVWLSNEAPGVLPDLPDEPAPRPNTDPFVLVRDGHTALALTDGHGAWVEWVPE